MTSLGGTSRAATLPADDDSPLGPSWALGTILERAPMMVCLVRPDGALLSANREARRLLGWPAGELLRGPNVTEFLHPERQQRDPIIEFIARAGQGWSEFVQRTNDGRLIRTHWSGMRLGDLVVGFGIDITSCDQADAGEGARTARRQMEGWPARHVPPANPNRLTLRELKVLSLAAEGAIDREIARQLGVSHRTVQSHISRILMKMGAKARTEAAVRAVREGIIE